MARDRRRLAAIVSADVAGYSRLMGEDESRTLAALKAHRHELVDPKIAEYGGRIVKTTGDGLLLEFPSVVDAIQCAVDMQRGMAERNVSVAADRQIRFRIGINVGDIIVDGDDIYGDGVNVAARLEALAEPGGICVSAMVRDQARVDLSVEFTDLGEQNVKNIKRPIRVFRLGLRTGTKEKPAGAAGSQESPSIAVLPFVNRSHDEADEYFSDGLADELLNVLAKIRGLHVAARSSAFTFKGKNATVAEVGRALNVATVLEGSVRKSGNRMRIAVQLVKVSDGYHLWSESYNRTLEDIFAVQDDIAQSVVKELRATLLGESNNARVKTDLQTEVRAAARGRGDNAEAYRLYLQGRFFEDRLTPENMEKAIDYYRRSVETDPTYALAWSGLSRGHTNQGAYTRDAVGGSFHKAREAAERALKLEPDLAEGHRALAQIRILHDWDWKGAEICLRRALELSPSDAEIMRTMALLTGGSGRLQEAIDLLRRAAALDPLSVPVHRALAVACWCAGQLDLAEVAATKAIELNPQGGIVRTSLGLMQLEQGRLDEAQAMFERETLDVFRLFGFVVLHHMRGDKGRSDAALRELIDHGADAGAVQIAGAYAYRREADQAFHWLDRAYAQRDAGLWMMKVSPMLRNLHGDPRWPALLERLSLVDL